MAACYTRGQAKQIDNVMPGTPNVYDERAHQSWCNDKNHGITRYLDLGKLLAGLAPGRERPEETTCFVNNIGLGLQFAAAGALVLKKAREAGVGRELPDEWFSEDVHPDAVRS